MKQRKRSRWTHSKCCPEMVPNAGKRTNHNFWKWLALHTWTCFFAKFFHYPLPLSEVISSFLFLRNTFQFWGRHSKCDVWRVSHHWETGKTWQNKCFERNPLKCPQSLRECCAIKTACIFLYKSCEKRWFPGKFWIWALVAAFSSVWDVYWCNHIPALPFELDLEPLVLTAKCVNFHEFP